ncbi:MAG: histidine triad family protein [Clostridiales bacterium]|nr:histidine triad family protein [Clostridiales bacterium]
MEDCIICNKHKKNTELMIYRDEYVCVCHYISNLEGNNNFLGYYFVEMMRHFDGIQNATEEELYAMIKVTKRLANALIIKFGGERIYTFVTGDGVKHFHEHVVIKHNGTPKEYKACRVDEWPEAPRGGYEDIVALNKEIKKIMNME